MTSDIPDPRDEPKPFDFWEDPDSRDDAPESPILGKVVERWTGHMPEEFLLDHNGELWSYEAIVVVDRTHLILIDAEAFDEFMERWA